MNRFRLWLGAVLALGFIIPAHAQTDKPNILAIITDDIGVSNVSAYSMGMAG
jgi:hypothetical protein